MTVNFEPYQSDGDHGLAVSMGRVAGQRKIVIAGENLDLDKNVTEDIWSYGGFMTYLTSAETMDIKSTSGQDSSIGSGMKDLLIIGLDADYNEIRELVTLNGMVPVTTTNSFIRVRLMIGLHAGVSNENAGEITATSSSTSHVQAHINPAHGISTGTHYTVPAGKAAYMMKAEYNTNRDGDVAFPLVRVNAQVRGYGLDLWIRTYEKDIDAQIINSIEVEPYFIIPMHEKTDFRLQAYTDRNNTRFRARIYILEVDAEIYGNNDYSA